LTEVQKALEPLIGNVVQQPPEYSAIKRKGKRAYDLARAGKSVELAPRMVQINRIEVRGYTWPLLELEIDCSTGTYIRAIARDVGESLGCGGYVQSLLRTRIGPFTREAAIDPRELTADKIRDFIRPARDAVSHLKNLVIDAAGTRAVLHGQAVSLPGNLGREDFAEGLVALLDQESRLLALAEPDFEQGVLQPRRVLFA
jgi:tRNA pseudouridine55 synthase